MARKTKVVQIQTDGRDRGKNFLLTEMPAMQAERWAMRAFQGMLRANVELPEDIQSAGLAGIAKIGFKALGNMDEFTFLSLMDEMLGCVQILPNPNDFRVIRPLIREGDEPDIQEVTTLIKLRMEVFELHTGFSLAGATSTATGSSAVEAAPA